ncbi:LysR family transcriptional regulator [Burkholderia sp. 3C]
MALPKRQRFEALPVAPGRSIPCGGRVFWRGCGSFGRCRSGVGSTQGANRTTPRSHTVPHSRNDACRAPSRCAAVDLPHLEHACMNHLRFLSYVDEVARTGSVRQASERLHVAPSAVLRRIQDIEDELGTPIFERLPRGMRLTAAGELFIQYVRTRLAELERVRSEIEDLQGLRRGLVRLTVSQAVASAFLPKMVASFRKRHSLVGFQIRVTDHVQALNALRMFDTDLALVFNLSDEPDIERIAEFEQRLCVIMHRTHPLASEAGPIRLRDCGDYPLVMPNREIGGRQLLDRFLSRRSFRLHPVVECNSFEFLRGYLHYEQALSFQIHIGAGSESGEYVSRDIEDRGFPKGTLALASLRGRQLPVIAYSFIEHLKQGLEESAALAL